jgi:CRP-like cAMP-binding protein
VLGDKLEVRLDSSIRPERCLDALKAATLACRIPLRDPPPSVACSSLHGDGTVYQIGYRVATSVDLVAARTELCTQLHRHLAHAGIGFAVPGVAAGSSVSEPSPAKVLADSDLFGILHPTERDELAAHFRPAWLNPNDTLIRQGATVEALFIVVTGVVEVVVSEPGGPRVLDRISPGGSIGAIGLVTGVPFSATATALTPLKVYRLDKSGFAAAIAAMPELVAGLEAVARRGQAALLRDAGAHENTEIGRPDVFLSKLHEFLRRLNE